MMDYLVEEDVEHEEKLESKKKRPKNGERKVQILQTIALMLEKDISARITTAGLAKKLDISEAALYRHFASKAKMFEALIEFIEDSIFSMLNQIRNRNLSALDQIKKIMSVVLIFGEKNPGMARVMVGDALVYEDPRLLVRVNKIFDKLDAQIRQILQEEMGQDSLNSYNYQSIAVALVDFIVGSLQRFSRTNFKKLPNEHLSNVLQFFFN